MSLRGGAMNSSTDHMAYKMSYSQAVHKQGNYHSNPAFMNVMPSQTNQSVPHLPEFEKDLKHALSQHNMRYDIPPINLMNGSNNPNSFQHQQRSVSTRRHPHNIYKELPMHFNPNAIQADYSRMKSHSEYMTTDMKNAYRMNRDHFATPSRHNPTNYPSHQFPMTHDYVTGDKNLQLPTYVNPKNPYAKYFHPQANQLPPQTNQLPPQSNQLPPQTNHLPPQKTYLSQTSSKANHYPNMEYLACSQIQGSGSALASKMQSKNKHMNDAMQINLNNPEKISYQHLTDQMHMNVNKQDKITYKHLPDAMQLNMTSKDKSQKHLADAMQSTINNQAYFLARSTQNYVPVQQNTWTSLAPMYLFESSELQFGEMPEELNDYETPQSLEERLLGKGSFGLVIKARPKDRKFWSSNNYFIAIKVISKDFIQQRGMGEQLKREIDCHTKSNHPNILTCITCYHTNYHSFLLLDGMEQNLQNFSCLLSEKQINNYINQLVDAASYLHENLIIHRDIKLDNILWNPDDMIRLSDFGWCNTLENGPPRDTSGSFQYMAPEVLKGEPQTTKVDMWSIGCCTFELFTGTRLFQPHNPPPNFNIPPNEWNKLEMMRLHSSNYHDKVTKILTELSVSDEAIQFINDLLCYNPDHRISSRSALNHPWFQSGINNSNSATAGNNFIMKHPH